MRAGVLTEAANLAIFASDPAQASCLAIDAMNDCGPVRDLRIQAMAIASLAWTLQGRSAAALHIAAAISPLMRPLVAVHPYPSHPAMVTTTAQCLSLVLAGRLAEAAALTAAVLDELTDDAKALRAAASSAASRVALLQGQLDRARHHAQQAVVDAGPGPGGQWASASLAMAAAQAGDLATAGQALELATAAGPVIPLFTFELTLARSWVHAAHGERTMATATARRVATEAAAAGIALMEVLALVDLVRLGASDDAQPRLAVLAARIEGPYVRAAARYARAASADDAAGLDQASTAFEAMGATLLAAEAAATAANAHRRAGRGSRHRAALTRARDLASACNGAHPPAIPALGDIDIEPAVHTLTRREREVVELAARGRTNRQIAHDLYVSIRTVDAHLCHAYAKLGTNDRSRLTTLLAFHARDSEPKAVP
jgi:ATP/maltotriose-dependent transcriptional regulator MalT